MPRARTAGSEDLCIQHHVPKGDCPPESRHPHTIRARDDDWAGAQEAEGREEIARWIAETMQARLMQVRCRRCDDRDPPVPLEPGDLTGKPLDHWIREAVRRAESQHPDHGPVRLGAEPVPVAAGDITATFAHLRSQIEQVQAQAGNPVVLSAPPATALFMEPGGTPVTGHPVPEARDHRGRKGRVKA